MLLGYSDQSGIGSCIEDSRPGKGEIALTAVTVDEVVPAAVVGEIAALDGIEDVRRVEA